MKHLLLIILVLSALKVFGQDTIPQKSSERWRNVYIPKTLLRVGFGFQKSPYTEIGFTRRKYSGEDLFVIGTAYYGALEWTPGIMKNPQNVYGVKFGGEITIQPMMIGLEMKYQNDFYRNSDFVITPKIGIGAGNFTGSILSSVYFCYGYNVSFNKKPFEGVGGHQFSLVMNPVHLSYVVNKKNYTKKN
jgi:hypothetical protein